MSGPLQCKFGIQVMFLLYHYFEAREAYNAIRVLIAGYVWMTGYGNFHYYYRYATDYHVHSYQCNQAKLACVFRRA